jgi:putative oxidoreductase
MSDQKTTLDDWGKLLLRLSVGGLMLFHGIDKLTNGTAGITQMLVAKGLPEAMVYGVYVGEIVAPLLLLAGMFTRVAGLIVAGNMGVAIMLAHTAELTAVSAHGGSAVELQMLYLMGALALACMGGGKLSVNKR